MRLATLPPIQNKQPGGYVGIAAVVRRFWDKYGTLDKLWRPDGGDSAHRVGMYYALLGMMSDEKKAKYPRNTVEEFLKVAKLHHVSPGVLVRHPNKDWDSSDWDRMSRDQMQPFIIACGFYSRDELAKFTKGHALRGFLFANNTRKNGANKFTHGKLIYGEVRDYSWKFPDPTGPDIWGNFIRAWGLWYLWPILLFTDLEMLIGSFLWRFFPKHNIAMNHTLTQLQAMKTLGTPLSWLSGKLMPVPRLITLIEDHFNDFPDDMIFFGMMFKDAYERN